MIRLDIFDLLGGLFPRLVGILVVAALIFAPRLVGHELVAAGREEARQITTMLESAITIDRHHHHRQGQGSPIVDVHP